MLGTLIAALEVREVKLENGQAACDVEGRHEIVDGLPLLREVHVHYRLKIPRGTRERVDRALARHQDKCPTANTLKGAVSVRWTADIEEG
jgi:uncharacterized OsmC-like protein